MNLAVSNIAWLASEEPAIAARLREQGISRVEIAPTRIAGEPSRLRPGDLRAYRNFWEDHGITVAAMQALLFGRSDLVLFGAEAKRRETIDYLRGIIDIAAAVGATILVFGSPRNRAVGALGRAQVLDIEREFFTAVGRHASTVGATFCIEPNPPAYGCDYLTTSVEVREMLQRVDAPGLGLHLDAAAMTMSGEGPAQIDSLASGTLRHFHISEPDLRPVRDPSTVDHAGFAASLRQQSYSGVTSIEMRPGPEGENQARVLDAIAFARLHYGDDERLP